MARLLLLEDDRDLQEELSEFLTRRDHSVQIAGSLKEFSNHIKNGLNIDVALIDVMLPDGSGYEAVQVLREISERTGIIFLTAKAALQDRLTGLETGGDHYLLKPFNLDELSAIIDALLRRVGPYWGFVAHLKQLRSPNGESLNLNTLESSLFELLATTPEAMVHRATLIESMGHDWVVFDLRRLDTAISRLRSKWKEKHGMPLPLRTHHGVGYGFDCPIRKI